MAEHYMVEQVVDSVLQIASSANPLKGLVFDSAVSFLRNRDNQYLNDLKISHIAFNSKLIRSLKVDENVRHLKNDLFESKDLELKILRSNYIKLMMAFLDKSLSSRDLEKIISSDPSLVVSIIKVANSPFYKGMDTVKSIMSAIMRLGREIIFKITLSSAVSTNGHGGIFFSDNVKILEKDVWKFSLLSASIASKIMNYLNKGDEADLTFLIGLLSAIGYYFILVYYPNHLLASHIYSNTHDSSLCHAEQIFLGTEHFSATLNILERRSFPVEIIEELRNVYSFTGTRAHVVSLSQNIAKAVFYGSLGDPFVEFMPTDPLLGMLSKDILNDIISSSYNEVEILLNP